MDLQAERNYSLLEKNVENSGEPLPLMSTTEALEKAGDKNWYQIRTTILLALQWTIIAFIVQGQPFLFLPPDFQCKDASGKIYACKEVEACDQSSKPTVWPGSTNSLIVEFELYCDRRYLKTLEQTLYFVFSNVATLFFSYLSDSKGRKYSILWTYIVGVVPLIFCAFAPNWPVFMVLFTISGLGLTPYTALCFVLLSESAGEKYRQISSIFLLMTWGIGQILFVPIAYYYPDWNIEILYFIGLPLFVQIVTYIWIYESPKFMIMKRRYNEAETIIRKIADTNKKSVNAFKFSEHDQDEKNTALNEVSVQSIDSVSTVAQANQQEAASNTGHRSYNYWDLIKYPSLRKITIILSYAYFTLYLCYYGAIFALASLGGNVYMAAIYVNIAELVAYIISNPIVQIFKRRSSFCVSLFALSVSCLCFFFSTSDAIFIILAMITKFAVAIGFSITYVYTQELYPTSVRSLGVGICTFLGKFGCALAPVLIDVFQNNFKLHPMTSFGLIGIFSSFLVLALKETKNLPLQDEIAELIEQDDGKALKKMGQKAI